MNTLDYRKIKDIAEVISGYNFRTKLEKQPNGNTLVLQARNITEWLMISEDDLLRINLEDNRTNAFAKNNDVVLSSRGSFKASVMETDSNTVIAASSVYLLRLKTTEVLPEYLAIYLNSNFGQSQINDRVTGVVINNLLKKDVADLEITIPSIANQQKIINIYFNILNYQERLKRKQQLTSQIHQGLINKLINS